MAAVSSRWTGVMGQAMQAARGLSSWGMAACVLALTAGSAAAEGDAAVGRVLAERWCANCHMTDPGQAATVAQGVPTFAAIAAMPSTTELSLRAFFRSPHVRMPDLHLTNQEIEDVSAYILGLRKR